MSNLQQRERTFRFHYETTVPAGQVEEGALELWVPLAKTTDLQTVGPVEVVSPFPWRETEAGGNRMLHCHVPRGPEAVTVRASYDVKRRAERVEVDQAARYGGRFLASDQAVHLLPSSHVPTDGFILEQARAVVSEADPPGRKARKLFDHLMSTFEYDTRGCTPDRIDELGKLDVACDLMRGTCTEFHGLLVGYARAVGVPARFSFGFNVPPAKPEGSIAGYHCWAELFLPEVGWAPMDVTESLKARMRGSEKDAEFYFGGVSCDRLEVSRGRDVPLEPPAPTGAIDKLIFAHAARGGERIDLLYAFSFSLARGS